MIGRMIYFLIDGLQMTMFDIKLCIYIYYYTELNHFVIKIMKIYTH